LAIDYSGATLVLKADQLLCLCLSTADCAEHFDAIGTPPEPGTVVTVTSPATCSLVAGVLVPVPTFPSDAMNTRKSATPVSAKFNPLLIQFWLMSHMVLHESCHAYDKKVAGVVSGAVEYWHGLVLNRRSSEKGRIPSPEIPPGFANLALNPSLADELWGDKLPPSHASLYIA
jgi:hypothetical protein